MLLRIIPLVSLLIFASSLLAVSQQNVPLPQKTGPLNDYAAVLGPESRKSLQDLITSLQTNGKTQATILFSRLDPYSNPQQFIASLWTAWELEKEHSVFLLFVTEEDVWKFQHKTSADLFASFSEPAITKALADVNEAVADRRVSQAAIDFLKVLTSQFVVIPEEPVEERSASTTPSDSSASQDPGTTGESSPLNSGTPSRKNDDSSLLLPIDFWYVAGGIGLAVALLLLIRAAFLSSCPKCGGQLKKRQETPIYSQLQRRSTQKKRGRVVYYCPQCRYQR